MLAVACNTVDPGQCWPNTSGGLGGGGPIPIGAGVGVSSGDFLTPSPHPQKPNPCVEEDPSLGDTVPTTDPCSPGDTNPNWQPSPMCLLQPQGPCYEQCYTDYGNAALVCAKIGDDAQRMACQDKAYADYKACRDDCATNRSLSDDCQEKYEDCINNAPTSCLKKVGGMTLCKRCQQRCEAGDSPSAECRKCHF